ncbi:MAG: cohesin domain-containing protein [Porcipelethomonas sp.]
MKKNVFSRTIAVLASMTVLGAATMVTASAAGIQIASVEGAAGETVEMPISLVGIDSSMGCVVSVTYPEALEVSAALPGNMAAQDAASNGDGTATVAATFVAPAGLATDFTSMKFVIPADAEDGTVYDITLGVDQLDNNGEFVEDAEALAGTITVVNPTDAPTEEETDAPTEAETDAPVVTTAAPATTAKPAATGSPKTGTAGVAVAVAGLVTAGATAVVLKKKH